MAFGQVSWVVETLLERQGEREQVVEFKVEEAWYGSTSGPWGGIGGAAMTRFTMTLLTFPEGYVVFADRQRMGRCRDAYVEELLESFPFVKAEWFE